MDFLNNVRTFLNDVCVFLDGEVLKTNQNEDVKAKATQLIANAMIMKEQGILQMNVMSTTNGYVDMMQNIQKVLMDEYIGPEIKPVYAPQISCEQFDTKPIMENSEHVEQETVNSECPYQNDLYDDLYGSFDGLLRRKEQMLNYISRNRQYIALLVDEWMMLYHTNRKHKALVIQSLKGAKATSPDNKGGTFLLDVDGKTFTLTAATYKEKMRWVSEINDISAKYKLYEQSRSSISKAPAPEPSDQAPMAPKGDYQFLPPPVSNGPKALYQYLPAFAPNATSD